MKAQELEVVEEQGPGGLSRRDLITRTAVAGGLIWAAPVLAASPVAAQVGGACPDCQGGTLAFLKLASEEGNNCGNITCTPEQDPQTFVCGQCLLDVGLVIFEELEFVKARVRVARITLSPPLKLVRTCIQVKSKLYEARCETNFAEPTGRIVVSGGGTTVDIDTEPGAIGDPLNEIGLIICIAAGTPVPGCPDLQT